jgi:hypothetical protein
MGGNRFKGVVSPIKRDNIYPTIKMYQKELRRLFPDVHNDVFRNMITLGSVGKKPQSGDIDLGINVDLLYENSLESLHITEDEYNAKFQRFKSRSRTATDEQLKLRTILTLLAEYIDTNSILISCDKKVGSGNMYTTIPQCDENGDILDIDVQVDWMVGDLDWLRFSYYSSALEGNLKGLHRTQMIVAMFATKGYIFRHEKGVRDKQTDEWVCSKPSDALELLRDLYTDKLTMEHLHDFNKLYNLLKEWAMVYDLHDMLNTYLNILDKTRCDIPDVLQDYYIEHREEKKWTGKFLPETSNLKQLV